MNEQKNMQTIVGPNSFQNMTIDEICQKIYEVVIDGKNISKDKYEAKQKLIESADDMTTQEKLDAMDMNYERLNQERWQNVFYFAVIYLSTLGLAIGSSAAVKKVHRLLTTT